MIPSVPYDATGIASDRRRRRNWYIEFIADNTGNIAEWEGVVLFHRAYNISTSVQLFFVGRSRDWNRRHWLAYEFIMKSLTNDEAAHSKIINCKTAHEAWEVLAKEYG